LLLLHLQPINPVVFRGLTAYAMGVLS